MGKKKYSLRYHRNFQIEVIVRSEIGEKEFHAKCNVKDVKKFNEIMSLIKDKYGLDLITTIKKSEFFDY